MLSWYETAEYDELVAVRNAGVLATDCGTVLGCLVHSVGNSRVRCQCTKADVPELIGGSCNSCWQCEIFPFPLGFNEESGADGLVAQDEINISRVHLLLAPYAPVRPREDLMEEAVDYLVPRVGFVERSLDELFCQFFGYSVAFHRDRSIEAKLEAPGKGYSGNGSGHSLAHASVTIDTNPPQALRCCAMNTPAPSHPPVPSPLKPRTWSNSSRLKAKR